MSEQLPPAASLWGPPPMPSGRPESAARPTPPVLPSHRVVPPPAQGRNRLFAGMGIAVFVAGMIVRLVRLEGWHLSPALNGVLGGVWLLGGLVLAATLALRRGTTGTVRDGLVDVGVAVGRLVVIVIGLIIATVVLVYLAWQVFGP